jgi:integrase
VLTDLACRRAKAEEKPYKLRDGQGLYLEVLPSGAKSWRWKYRIGGKEKRLTFGLYPGVTAAEAREKRAIAARALQNGQDPALEKRQRKAAATAQAGASFEAMAVEWMQSQEPVWSQRHAALVKSSLEKDVFPHLGSLPIDSITTPLVLEVLRPIEARGAIETAHRTRQRLSEIFARAIGSGIATTDPAAVAGRALGKVAKGKFPAVRTIEVARDVLRKVEAQPAHPLTKLGSRLLALTAVRSAALRLTTAEEFEELDGPNPIWRIPANKMKLAVERKRDQDFAFVVPLSRQAVATVKVAMGFSGKAALIFRSVRHPRRPISDSTISKAYRDAGFAGVHVPHGWRSTFSTVMNERAAVADRISDRAIIDLMLAHIPEGVEAAYNRASYMPRRRQLAQEWADLLTQDLVDPVELLTGPRRI